MVEPNPLEFRGSYFLPFFFFNKFFFPLDQSKHFIFNCLNQGAPKKGIFFRLYFSAMNFSSFEEFICTISHKICQKSFFSTFDFKVFLRYQVFRQETFSKRFLNQFQVRSRFFSVGQWEYFSRYSDFRLHIQLLKNPHISLKVKGLLIFYYSRF